MAQPAIDPDLLRILVCPLTRSPLRQDGDTLIAERPANAGLRYPVRDGIPILLVDEAELPEGIDSLDTFRQRFANDIPAPPAPATEPGTPDSDA